MGERVTTKNARVGLLVVRGRDWIFGDQDGGQPSIGKVTCIRTKNKEGESWINVYWPKSDIENCYRIGDNGAYDLEIYLPESKIKIKVKIPRNA